MTPEQLAQRWPTRQIARRRLSVLARKMQGLISGEEMAEYEILKDLAPTLPDVPGSDRVADTPPPTNGVLTCEERHRKAI